MAKQQLSSKNKQQKLIIKIEQFDNNNVVNYINQYSKLIKKDDIDPDIEYKNQLLKKIRENYYTFQHKAINKKFSFIKTIIYRQLFKYLHRQIYFNDYVKSVIELINDDIEKNKKRINFINSQQSNNALLESKIINQESNNSLLECRLNAIYEMQKKSIIGQKKIKTSNSSAYYFSQFGEDRWIIENFKLPNKGYFIDVGAADGITFSNTYYFEKMGWKGLCFEPNPENYLLANKFRKNVEQVAISNKTGSALLKINEISPDWSSLIDNQKLKNQHNIIPIKTKTLDQVIKNNKIKKIDLLSIDVEGHELAVLESFDISSVLPKIIIVEFLTQGNKSQKNSLTNFFKKLPYSKEHETQANFIFKLRD